MIDHRRLKYSQLLLSLKATSLQVLKPEHVSKISIQECVFFFTIILFFSVHKETVNAVLFSPGKSHLNISVPL